MTVFKTCAGLFFICLSVYLLPPAHDHQTLALPGQTRFMLGFGHVVLLIIGAAFLLQAIRDDIQR